MPVITPAILARIFNKGEVEISRDIPFLVERASFSLVAGQSNITLPDYVTSIRRITYLGTKIWPIGQRIYRQTFQAGGQIGTPFWYIYNNIASNVIQLFPAPPEDMPQATGDLWGAGIPTGFIIEYNRLADNVNFVLPAWIRNRILKRYVAYQTFLMEGPNQSNKFMTYFKQQYGNWEATFKSLLEYYYMYGRNPMITGKLAGNFFPASPILPIDRFGISVDIGE